MAYATAMPPKNRPKHPESYNGCSRDFAGSKGVVEKRPRRVGKTNLHLTADLVSAQALSDAFWAQVDRSGDCWLWTGPTLKRRSHRYGYLWDAAQKKTAHAHRVAWELQHGPIPAGLQVLHRCDEVLCMRHLFLGTQLDNMRDMAAKGRRSPDAHRRKGTYTWTPEHRAKVMAARRQNRLKKLAEAV